MISTLPDVAAGIANVNTAVQWVGVAPLFRVIRPPESFLRVAWRRSAPNGASGISSLGIADDQAIAQLKDEFTAGTCDPVWLTTLEAYEATWREEGAEGGARAGLRRLLESLRGRRDLREDVERWRDIGEAGARLARVAVGGGARGMGVCGTGPAYECLGGAAISAVGFVRVPVRRELLLRCSIGAMAWSSAMPGF